MKYFFGKLGILINMAFISAWHLSVGHFIALGNMRNVEKRQNNCSNVLQSEMTMKKCPFCAEEIQDAAIKCKHCGEFLDGSGQRRSAEENIQWYFRTSVIVLALACVGPMALPLIWWRPKTSKAWKIGLTVGILVLSWVLFEATMEAFRTIQEYYEIIEGL